MNEKPSEEELKAFASQLGCPAGEEGIEVGDMLNEKNITMTLKTIEALDLKDNDNVMEMGHGNCGHLHNILKAADNISFSGLEISALMKSEAEKINTKYVDGNQASFHLYDGTLMPFEDDTFDKILTVNTIYFWKDAMETMREVYRVIKKNGRFSIAYGHKETMEKLPFIQYGFQLYNEDDVSILAQKNAFKVADIAHHTDELEMDSGEVIERRFVVTTLEK